MSTPDPAAPVEQRQRTLVRTSQINYWEWLFRVGILVALVGSVFLAWWSLVHVLLPRQRQARELFISVDHLNTEVYRLERKWSKEDAEQLNQQFKQARDGLFVGDAALANWFNELKDQATPLGLDLQAEFGKPATNSLNLAVIPATITVEVRPLPGVAVAPAPSGYQRVLQFSRKLTSGGKRADLLELTVKGGTNSVYAARFVLSLWAGKEEPQ